MHEAGIAQGLLETICMEADRQKARPVRAKISCGRLNAINGEVLNLAFEALAQGTACEGMALDVEHKPFSARCRACGAEFVVDIGDAICPTCARDDFDLFPDAPLILESIEFEQE